MRLIKQNKLASYINGGRVGCEKCRKVGTGQTESPAFWENGSYCFCSTCKRMTLARPVYPATDGYPDGFEIVLTGERKDYPVIAPKKWKL